MKSFEEEFRQSANYYQTASNVHKEIEKISAGIKENKLISREQFDDLNYKANYGTDEQVARDKQITQLLTKYVHNYSNKIEKNGEYKEHIFMVCESIIIMYAIIIPVVILFACSSRRGRITTGADVAALISVCVSFLGLIIGLMQIITKYVFPEKEEEYITQIVRAIQENDLKHKEQNMRYLSQLDKDMSVIEEKKEDINICEDNK